jgi:TonB family protein
MRLALLFCASVVLFCGVNAIAQTPSHSTQGQNNPAPPSAGSPVEVLSDTAGFDIQPYLQMVVRNLKMNWYSRIPQSARAPIKKKGKLAIKFDIDKSGKIIGNPKVDPASGDMALDHAAYEGLLASNPFPPLPSEFKGAHLALRFTFYYNPDKSDFNPVPAIQSPNPSKE